ncbi:MAG: hypothetical protein HY334_06405, partial [Armatimonadetes bacterium]|nr:hypothetical protein [Armatimonadota bacterium]
LLDVPLDDLVGTASPRVVEGLRRVREGQVLIRPGYDGVFGEIHIFEGPSAPAAEESALPLEEAASQIRLF